MNSCTNQYSQYSIVTPYSPIREEIKGILEKRLISMKEKASIINSFDGKTVLETMQLEFEGERKNNLKNSIAELKNQNESIGKEFDLTVKQLHSLSPSKAQIDLMFQNVSELLINEGITPDLVEIVMKEAKEYLQEISPNKIPGIIERSLKAIPAMLLSLENGEKITQDLIAEKERSQEIIPLLNQFWVNLEEYQKIMSEVQRMDDIKSIARKLF